MSWHQNERAPVALDNQQTLWYSLCLRTNRLPCLRKMPTANQIQMKSIVLLTIFQLLTRSPTKICARLYIATPMPFHSASSRKHGNSSVIIRSKRRAEWSASMRQFSNFPSYFSSNAVPTSCKHLTRSSSKGTLASSSSPRSISDNSSSVIFE